MARTKEKHAGGRPRMYDSVEVLQEAIDAYFENPINFKKVTIAGEEVKIPILTITGLAYSLGFLDRQSFYDYLKRDDEFSCIIKKARFFIEANYEAKLQSNNPTGCIFALKNMGWRDRQDIEQKISGNLGVSITDEEIAKMTPEEKIEYINKQINEG